MNDATRQIPPSKAGAGSAGLDVSGVTVTYRNGHTALADASFSIPRGTITALVGVSAIISAVFFVLMHRSGWTIQDNRLALAQTVEHNSQPRSLIMTNLVRQSSAIEHYAQRSMQWQVAPLDALELAAEGRWLVDPMQAESTDEPVDLAAIRLDRLSLRLGQALFEGSGRFDTDRDAGSFEQAMEMGRGAFTFILRGGEALLARLGSEGVLPADQAFLAQMMMGALARQVGEDHLESLVTITPPGQVMVNGMPLPF